MLINQKPVRQLLFLLLALLFVGCGQRREENDAPEGAPTPLPTTAPPSLGSSEATVYGYTHQRPDGNRLVTGRGALPTAVSLDIPLDGRPDWIVAAPVEEGAVWATVLTDGRTQAFRVNGETVEEIAITPQSVEGVPPLLQVAGGEATLLAPSIADPGPAPPAILDEAGRRVFSLPDGGLTFLDPSGGEEATLDVSALPDSRLLVDEAGRLLLLSEPTTRYDHGVVGDSVEAAGITLVETGPEPQVKTTIPIPEPQVVEGIAPLWADLNGDGQREIIVTLSSASDGAQIVAFDEAGTVVATGPAIGRGYRWRHQIAVAPFGPNGQVELVDVLTPHIGGVVEFYQWQENELRIVARVPGFTSHVIGTRNLDMAVAGDFDGDGRIELLLPNQQRTELGGIQRTNNGAEVAWTVPVEGRVVSNLAAVTLANAMLAVGVGREDGVLRIWLP